MKTELNRRMFLRGAGVALALPLMESLGPLRGVEAAGAPRRIVAINIPLGFHAPNFFPGQTGRAYVPSPYLQVAEPLRNDFTVFSGMSHPDVDGGHSAEKSFLTAAPHPGSRSFKNSISLDQFVAGRIGGATRFASLTLGEHSLSWSANGVSVPVENQPAATYARLFLAGNAREVAGQKQQLRDGRSIMDTVLEDARAMERTVSRVDREKLGQYFTAVRETERRLTKAEAWVDTPKPRVDGSSPGRIASEDIIGRLRAFFDVITLALQTDSTRVITLGGHGGSLVPPIKGVQQGYHGLSHHGKNPEMIAQLALIERETMAAWSGFVAGLKQVKEGGATLLDHTQVLLGSNLGNASGHLTTNLPIILAGGRYRHGQHLRFDEKNNHPLPNLFVSMLLGLGLEVDSFASSKGTVRGLEPA